jgi:exodeoxyribonuclease VII large subunit
VLRAPETLLTTRAHEVEVLASRGRDRIDRSLQVQERRTAELRATLRALSPASTLARGYAIAHLADGVIVRDAAQAPASTPVVVTVGRGSFAAHSDGEIAEDASPGVGAPVDGRPTGERDGHETGLDAN